MLDGFYGPHRFTIEMTMGKLNVYFPTEDRWNRTAPRLGSGTVEKGPRRRRGVGQGEVHSLFCRSRCLGKLLSAK
jgi:hypothetical protein